MSSKYVAIISLCSALTIVVATGSGVSAQDPAASPPPKGQDIVASDGDRIILEDDARIQIVRRRQATVRTIFNDAERVLIVLIDYSKPGELPDGRVDFGHNYFDLEGNWPLGPRWEAFTTVEEYSATPQLPRGIGLATPLGLVQVLASAGGTGAALKDPSAAAVLIYRGGGSGGLNGLSFQDAEQHQLVAAARRVTMTPSGGAVSVERSNDSGSVGWSASSSESPAAVAAVRIGARALPAKIRDVAPVYPEAARQADVRGVVIVELNVGVDGTVTNARILRGVPLLDQAALDAVRQWQYQPLVMDGKPVPVTITAVVPFAPE